MDRCSAEINVPFEVSEQDFKDSVLGLRSEERGAESVVSAKKDSGAIAESADCSPVSEGEAALATVQPESEASTATEAEMKQIIAESFYKQPRTCSSQR